MSTPNPAVHVIDEELEEIVGFFASVVAVNTSGEQPTLSAEVLEQIANETENLGSLGALKGLEWLQGVCELLQGDLAHLAEQGEPMSALEREWLKAWPELVMDYLNAPSEPQHGLAMVQHLQSPGWRPDRPDEEVIDLQEWFVLKAIEAEAESEAGEVQTIEDCGDLEAWDQTSDPFSESCEFSEVGEEQGAPALDPETEPAVAQSDEFAHVEVFREQPQPEETDSENQGMPPEFDEAAQELVDLLRAELADIVEAREELVAPISDQQSAQADRLNALEQYAEQAHRIASAAELVGLDGLHQAVAHIHRNLLSFAEQAPSVLGGARSVLENWPVLVLGYLQTIHDRRASEWLVDGLRDPGWPEPLSEDDGPRLVELLSTPVVATEDQVPDREQEATPEDVRLDIQGDVNQELVDGLLSELPSQTEEFTAAVQNVIKGGVVGDLEVAQRIAHTLKGSSNLAGVKGIANLTHHLEDILEALAKHRTLPPGGLADTLMNAADCLEAMSETLLGVGAPPSDAVDVLQEVLDWANLIDREGISQSEYVEPGRKSVERKSLESPVPAAQGSGQPAEPRETPSKDTMLRISSALADDMLRLAGESIISNGQIQEQVERTIERVKSLRVQSQLVRQLVGEIEQLVDVRGITAQSSERKQHSEFDDLEMDQYSKLHTVTHRLLEATTDVGELTQSVADQLLELDRAAVDQGRIHRENQEIVLRTRMLPVKTVVPRLERIVRQSARLTDKEVNLQVVGAETLMDSEVLADLMDPLMHMLRNAVDHGIEPPEIREAQGKEPAGRIELVFARAGDRIIVSCRDDGRGLDFAAIRRVAEERGLIPKDKVLTEAELSRLTLVSGLTTRSKVTQVSGRGVGMDVVHARIKDMKGSLRISSQAGNGTLLELRLPVTLLAAHALLVRIGGQILALSNRGVEEIFYPGAGELRKMGSASVFLVDDKAYEVRRLDLMLNLPTAQQDAGDQSHPVLLIEDENGTKTAILVQEVLDSRDLVVKPLGQYVPQVSGVMGGAILGDGSVTPVLDLTELLHLHTFLPRVEQVSRDSSQDRGRALPTVLVVDDSLSARRSLAQFIRDLGYEVRTAQDGFEAINLIENARPDVILADLEMPRMNGLELTAHVRAQEATRNIPVIMVTSRSTEKHRQQADRAGVTAYVTKPFSEEALLQHIGAALG